MTEPHVWILWHKRVGDLKQMQVLAEALGFSCEVKNLQCRFSGMPVLAPWLVKPRLTSLLAERLPALILYSEALCAGVAQAIRQRSEGAVKIVAVGRPLGHPANADLILTTAQYGLPPLPHVVELALPLSAAPPIEQTSSSGAGVLLLVGAGVVPDVLDRSAAIALAASLRRYAEGKNATLTIVTSPRTPLAISAVLSEAVTAPHCFVAFDSNRPDDYRELLANAEEIVVTSDSISMTADALAMRKLVSVYLLPQKKTLGLTFGNRLHEWAYREKASAFSSLARYLFDKGVIECAPARQRVLQNLVASGEIGWFGDTPRQLLVKRSSDDMAIAVQRVKALLGDGATLKPVERP